jgi:hypothetical protein
MEEQRVRCSEETLDLRGMKQQETGEHYTIMTLIIITLHTIKQKEAGYGAHVGKMNTYRILIRKPQREIREDNIKMNFGGTGNQGMNRLQLAQDTVQ